MGNLFHTDGHEYDFDRIAKGLLYANSYNDAIAEFRYNHTGRVKDLALELADGYADEFKVATMAYLHDVFKYVDEEKHGLMAARFLRDFYVRPLLANTIPIGTPDYETEERDWDMVYEALKIHSDKTKNVYKRKANIYASVLIDADVLDHLTLDWCISNKELFYPQRTLAEEIKVQMAKVDEYDGTTATYDIVKAKLINALEPSMKAK